ncbi:Hypothetical protein HVR_LOCUS225 [uncultured virus]|nr:Hypothetical protein HVR_LOCUS225 [uncultured virus]
MNAFIEIDIYAIVTADKFSTKEQFLQTVTVVPEDKIQQLREQIRVSIPNPPEKIDLKIYKVKASRKDIPIQIMMLPEAPYAILSSDKDYTIQQVLDNTESEYDPDDELGRFFSLSPLPRVKIIAVTHTE